MRISRLIAPLGLVLVLVTGLGLTPAHAQEEGPRRLVAALGIGLGAQYDARDCSVGTSSSDFPGTSTCLLFAGGVDLSLLWRGRVGGMVALYSVSGVAAAINAESGVKIPAIPDRISVPLALDIRPLAFLPQARRPGYLARFLDGVALQAGPSVELVRTSSDQATGIGGLFRLALEAPLFTGPRNAVSLRFATHVLVAPQASLNGGLVCTDPACSGQGYGPVYQTYLGVVYYP